jgi:inositol hexakisphosphate/diphosphoinositol-pentakisphosphate kinase
LLALDKDVLNNVKIYTSSERRVVNTAEIFARALLGKENSGSSSVGSGMPADNTPLIEHLIQRRDLLDDNNAAKELTDQAKKKLKVWT